MARQPDPWDAAVNGIPGDKWDEAQENLMKDFERPMTPANDKAMSISLAFFVCSVVGIVDLLVVLLILKWLTPWL